MKTLTLFIALFSLTSMAFADKEFLLPKPVVAESEIHQDKKITNFVKSFKNADMCDEDELREARRLIRNCRGNAPRRQDRAECISDMKSFYGKRQSTSRDQDSTDAVTFCSRRYTSSDCANSALEFTGKRRSTTKDQDIDDAANFCIDRGDIECLDPTYNELSRRSGTSRDDDVNDTLSACSR